MAADSDPTYTTVPGKLAPLLKKMRETGVPPKATKAWLKTIGFTSSNDGSLLNVLRSIGFIDSPGVPTPVWKEYRGRDYKEILGRAVKSGYESLYAVYPDAHERPNADLSHVFSSQTTSGKQTVDKMVSTFKALAGEAEFSRADSGATSTGEAGQTATQQTPAESSGTTVVTRPSTTAGGLTVNINVQLTLPEGADEQTFEAFFKAMKTHLFPDPE
ncbi:DUF5343 domain-containing protein [Mycobacterium conspicuum]|uniref:Uncharacterized protein n=1 Tax=Mycobacterium conspicuum TaxID=44010 RepID=A0A1X1T6N4_9MYCO|nr:DUF5343 domain-containing protein [Mycobacterium conspicuum]ORV40213.1 hypothetical protein AWC00_16225 [Mycobacterium conspicuum]BBZ37092.1 hypothetical protein MCNS_01550 [Mycobacterium conspicuum]